MRGQSRYLFLVACLILPLAAAADVSVCNDTPDLQTVAIGHVSANRPIVTEGWWALDPGACASVTVADDSGRILLLARAPAWQMIRDDATLCTTSSPFLIRNTGPCEDQGADSAAFQAVDGLSADADHVVHLSGITARKDAAPQTDADGDGLAQLQGEWVSVDDANDRMRISGTQRRMSYGDRDVGQEEIAVTATCLDQEGDGPYLRSRDAESGDMTCYAIEALGASELVLMHLPRGNLLVYRRPH